MATFFTIVKDNIRGRYNRVKDNIRSRYNGVKDKITTRCRLDAHQVVQEYDAFLQYPLVTTSAFQDILDGKLNRKRRALQLAVMLHFCLYSIPRYCVVILLYFQGEKTRMHYQYILADYNEEMGMLGRTANVNYVIFGIGIILNTYVTRKFEGQGSLEFLTDWFKRISRKPSIEDTAPGDLDNESRHKLMSSLQYKLIIARIMARNAAISVQLFELIAFSLFIYKRRPSLWITCVGLWNCITILIDIEIATYHLHSLYLSYVVTTDYFKVVINSIMRKLGDLKTREITNRNVTAVLDDYEYMMNDFKKYNRVLKPLLGNLVHFYVFELTGIFCLFTLKAETWTLATTIGPAATFGFIISATGVYVTQLNAKVSKLHNTLVSLCARHIGDKRQRLSLNCMFRLKHIICELGSLETDGQFVIGLRDGEGAATSRMQIFDLTMQTLSNTLMILGFVNAMDSM